jgi:hypothetical protein
LGVFAVLLIALRPQAVHGQGRKDAVFYGRLEARAGGNSEQGPLRRRAGSSIIFANNSSSSVIRNDGDNALTLPLRRHHVPHTDSFDWK